MRQKDIQVLNNFSTYKTYDFTMKNNLEQEEKKIEENIVHSDEV